MTQVSSRLRYRTSMSEPLNMSWTRGRSGMGCSNPFGTALGLIFSRRLQQLNVPVSSLDSSRGMSSEVIQMRDPQSGNVVQTAWMRELHATKNVIYAETIRYAVCQAIRVRA